MQAMCPDEETGPEMSMSDGSVGLVATLAIIIAIYAVVWLTLE